MFFSIFKKHASMLDTLYITQTYFIFNKLLFIALPPGSHQSKDWTPGFVKSTTSKSGMNTKGGSRDRYVNFSLFLYTISHKAKTTKNRPYR